VPRISSEPSRDTSPSPSAVSPGAVLGAGGSTELDKDQRIRQLEEALAARAANKKPKHNPPKPGKRADGAGPSGVHHQRTSSDRAPAGSAEEMRRIMAATQKKQQAELAARLRKEGK